MNWWHVVQHWLAVHTGTVNEPGPFYGFWSGFGSDLTEFAAAAAFAAGLIVSYRHKNCEVHGCLRLGRHQTAAGHHVCRKHHPDGHLSAEDVHEAHHAVLHLRHHRETAGDG